MSEVWVANASPVIVLAKVGYLELLRKLPEELLLPEAVVTEILAGPSSDPARQALENGWGLRASPKAIPSKLLEWGLGAGETAVLALTLEHSPCTAVLDDAAARLCAKASKIPVLGTLGVVLRAKKTGPDPSRGRSAQSFTLRWSPSRRSHHSPGPESHRRNLVGGKASATVRNVPLLARPQTPDLHDGNRTDKITWANAKECLNNNFPISTRVACFRGQSLPESFHKVLVGRENMAPDAMARRGFPHLQPHFGFRIGQSTP